MIPAKWIARKMLDLGDIQLIPSVEVAPGSIWVTEDQAPNGAAGYYERRRLPLEHRILQDRAIAVLEFSYRKRQYRIQCGLHGAFNTNLQMIVDALRTMFYLADVGMLTLENAISGFVTENPNDWWRVLRAPSDASVSEIETCYRLQAQKTHPDMGGSHEAFIRVQEAYRTALAGRQ